MKRFFFLPAALLAVGLFSCTDSETTAPQTKVGLKFNTVKTASSVNGRMDFSNSLSFTSGTITLEEVQFEAESNTDSLEVDFELNQDIQIDFATGKTTPNINDAVFKPGVYEEIEVEMELQHKGTKPAILLLGTFTDAEGKAHPVRFEFNKDKSFEVEKEGNIVVTEGQSMVAEVTFNPTAWFANVSAAQLANATKNAEGVIVISSTQNEDIFDIVADGLDLASEVEFED